MYRQLILCLCYFFLGYTSSEETTTSQYELCNDLRPQENIKIKLITGLWYVIEILQHKIDEKQFHGEKIEISTCPVINLTYAGSDTELKLYWEEDEGNVEYTFKITDKYNPGHWVSTGAQNGTLLKMVSYNQFAGTVNVKKAVNDHMVLTFCSPNTHLYSLIVARDRILDLKELKSITDHMIKLKLPVTQTKRTCRNSSSITESTIWLIITLCLTHAYFSITK